MSLIAFWPPRCRPPAPGYRFIPADGTRLGCGCPLDAFSAPVLCLECGHTRCLPHRDQAHDCKSTVGAR